MTSKVVVDYFSNNYFPHFGVPKSIVSDNAKVFTSNLFRNMCFDWGIKHITTSPFYPKSNLSERFFRSLKSALTIFHNVKQNTWDEYLPLFVLGFNDAVHESTKTTPAQLFLGRQINQPLELNWKITDSDINVNGLGLQDNQELFKLALHNLKLAKTKVAQRYNVNRYPNTFKIGDRVRYKLYPQSSMIKKQSAKLMLKWSEPYFVKRFLTPVTVELENSEGSLRKSHLSEIKLC